MLKVSNVSKDYGAIRVLRDISFRFTEGTSVAITGPSGSGKSTLLHIIGTLEKPTDGQVEINNTDPFTLSEPDLARYRNTLIGFVFQDNHLLPQYSVLENVLVPTFAFRNLTLLSGHTNSLNGLGFRIEHRIALVNFQEVNGSALPSLVHLLISRVFFSAMNRPEIWMRLPLKLSWIYSLSCTK